MADETRKPLKRRGGRWVTEGEPERNTALRAVVTRVWWLLVPLIGIVCSQDAYVRPQLMEAENLVNREKTAVQKMEDSLKAEVSKVDAEVFRVQGDIDSSFTPQVELYRSIVDSLRYERSLYDQSLPALKARAESLRTVQSELQQMLTDASAQLQARQSSIDSLKARRLALKDSIGAVSQDLVVLSDTWDHLANPDKYRKNTALVPGPGEYPNRDNLPRR